MLDSYHCMHFQEKLMIQTQENGQKTHFGPDLGLMGPNSEIHLVNISIIIANNFNTRPFCITEYFVYLLKAVKTNPATLL